MTGQITRDPAYAAVERDDFPAMMDVERYRGRSDYFDEIISRTHDHFWDPLDPAYIDYTIPFDLENETLLDRSQFPELQSAVCDRLDEGQQIALANEIIRWNMSNILHGEQGALSLSASLCHILHDQGAQEYAANQAREEARHVTAFQRYLEARWDGRPYPVGDVLGTLLTELVLAPEVYKKLVGMQMLVEGLAMGSFASLHARTNDPLMRRLTQLVMTDEAFHHRFGKIWAANTIPHLEQPERDVIEDWAAECFETLLFNLTNVRQKRLVYERFGLDWEWVRSAVREVWNDDERRKGLTDNTNIFRVLTKTLVKAGIITDRTRAIYANWIDMTGLEAEGDDMVGDAIAADGIEYLREINARRRPILRRQAVA